MAEDMMNEDDIVVVMTDEAGNEYYYREEMNTDGDSDPIGIVLGAYEDKLVMHYALQNITNQLFVSRYQLYLPNREQLEEELRKFLNAAKIEEQKQ